MRSISLKSIRKEQGAASERLTILPRSILSTVAEKSNKVRHFWKKKKTFAAFNISASLDRHVLRNAYCVVLAASRLLARVSRGIPVIPSFETGPIFSESFRSAQSRPL